jgi:hypothetical protein
MATIIDSLLVKLGLDSSEFAAGKNKVDKGLKDTGNEAEKAGAKLKKTGKDGAEGFNEVAKSATKFLAIIGGTVAIKRFVSDMIESNAALDRFSQNLNRSVSDISAWSNAAELAGGSAEGLQGTMDMLSKSQTELQLTGQSSLIPYFSALGVSLADAQGKARPVNDLLLELADRFSRMDRTTANNMGRMMGIDQGTMNLLLKGRGEVELLIKRQKEYGAVSKQQAEEASRLRNAMVASKQSFEAFGRELLSAATPALEKMFAIFSDFGSWIQENKEFVQTFLTSIAVGLAGIAAATIPINLTVAAVLALAAAIAALYQDYQTWKRGGESLIDWGKWEPGIKKAGEGIKWLRDMLGDMVYRAIAAADVLAAVFNRDWERAKFAAKEFWNGNGKEYGADEPGGAATGSGASSAPSAPSAPSPAASSGDKSLPRGIRNNNPGNLNFAGQAGATKEYGPNGRFAVFGSMQEGVAALVRQIGLYVKRGRNTIRKILEVYAPPGENNTNAYIAAVSKALGIGPDDALDTENAQQVMGLVRAITNHENGKGFVSDADIAGGFQLAKGKGTQGASQFAVGAGAVQVAQANAAGAPGGGSKSVETHIGEVKVYTAATDANGIAKDMGKSLDYLFTSQANYGLN